MSYVIVGLGNPGGEYENTRHNVGRIALEAVRKAHDLPEWQESKKYLGVVSEGKIGKEKALLLMPETFMNKSGSSVCKAIKSVKMAEKLLVVYDDIDLPLGKVKLSYDRGSGGHKGLESIMRALKTKAFTRVRVGVAPATAKGRAKKPDGEDKVINFILGKFKPGELEVVKKEAKKIAGAVETFVVKGREAMMSRQNL